MDVVSYYPDTLTLGDIEAEGKEVSDFVNPFLRGLCEVAPCIQGDFIDRVVT